VAKAKKEEAKKQPPAGTYIKKQSALNTF